jgi:hypothetical protein
MQQYEEEDGAPRLAAEEQGLRATGERAAKKRGLT